MENKKTAIILTIVAVGLFALVAFFFFYKPARDSLMNLTKPQPKETEEVTGELPELVCNYASDSAAYQDAIVSKNVNQCECIGEDTLKNTCKSAVMDISFYDRALSQLDETLCEKIHSDIQKDACHKVVQSSMQQFQDQDPQYIADVYAATHNEKAIGELEKLVVQNDGATVDNYVSLALAYAEKGLNEQEQGRDQTPYVKKAFEAIENAKAINDNNANVYRAEAYVNEIKPDYAQALALYDKALQIDSQNILAHAGKGHVYRIMGDLEDAVGEFNTAAQLDKENVYVFIYTNLCNLEYSRSHDEDAIKNCKIVIQTQNTDPIFQSEAFQIMALIFMQNDDLAQAQNYLLHAKTLTPNDPNLYVTFSKLHFFEQDYTQAQADAQKAIELSPTKAASYLALSRTLYMQEKYDEAIKEAQKGIALVQDDVSLLTANKSAMERDLNYVIANSYRQRGNSEKQQEYEQKAQESFNNSHIIE